MRRIVAPPRELSLVTGTLHEAATPSSILPLSVQVETDKIVWKTAGLSGRYAVWWINRY